MKHLAFIMDGNKRWGEKNKKSQLESYKIGLTKLFDITNFCIDNKIPYISAYAMSSENFFRPSINLIYDIIIAEYDNLIIKLTEDKRIKVNFIGEIDKLPDKISSQLKKITSLTNNYNKITLNIIINYSTENEIVNIINKIINSEETIKKITNIDLNKFLYLRNMPEPDLLIRTGGFQRLSNFLLIYLKYTELVFTKTLWPDLEDNELINIIENYNNIKKNYGL